MPCCSILPSCSHHICTAPPQSWSWSSSRRDCCNPPCLAQANFPAHPFPHLPICAHLKNQSDQLENPRHLELLYPLHPFSHHLLVHLSRGFRLSHYCHSIRLFPHYIHSCDAVLLL